MSKALIQDAHKALCQNLCSQLFECDCDVVHDSNIDDLIVECQVFTKNGKVRDVFQTTWSLSQIVATTTTQDVFNIISLIRQHHYQNTLSTQHALYLVCKLRSVNTNKEKENQYTLTCLELLTNVEVNDETKNGLRVIKDMLSTYNLFETKQLD